MMIDAVIPARGGSRRLPGKNLAVIGQRRLIEHSIQFALDHPRIRQVFVSTDDTGIADVAQAAGALVLARPAELATDDATTSSALQHAWGHIEREGGVDAIVTLQPTSPLRLPAWLDECAALLEASAFDSVITVSPVSAKVGTIEAGEFKPQYEFETRSQDLTHHYRENGLIYLTRSAAVAAGSVFGQRVGAVVTDHLFATIDIDTEADLRYAQSVMGLTE
ncbi:MAG: acylneuraminate cytidylyltransferase family protein [Aquihabitans sp.]